MKNFVSIRSQYYKIGEARSALDHAHAKRNGFTQSANVYPSLSTANRGYYQNKMNNCTDSFDEICARHQEVTRKKMRKDFNVLFEHVVVFSDPHFNKLAENIGLDKAANFLVSRLKQYMNSIKLEFGFEPIGFDLHLDEGHVDFKTQKFKRNVHAHVQFFNYDFQKRVAPLRHLMKKGQSLEGQTNQLNPNFVMMQDLAATAFRDIGFKRGISKDVTSKKHLRKEYFVMKKHKEANEALRIVKRDVATTRKFQNDKMKELLAIRDDVKEAKSKLDWLALRIKELTKLKEELQIAVVKYSRKSFAQLASRAKQLSITSLNKRSVK